MNWLCDYCGYENIVISDDIEQACLCACCSEQAPQDIMGEIRKEVLLYKRLGPVNKLAAASDLDGGSRNALVSETVGYLMETSGISQYMALLYIKVLSDIFQWNLVLQLPTGSDADASVFNAERYTQESTDPQYIEASDAYLKCNYQKAQEMFSALSESGNVLAGVMLGQMYWNGDEGLEKDCATALRLFAEGMIHGIPLANQKISQAYRFGVVLEKDESVAKKLLVSSKEAISLMSGAGCPSAMSVLGHNLIYSPYYETDENLGFQWLDNASRLGYVPAKVILAHCYIGGIGCEKDTAHGIALYEECVRYHNVDASYLLGIYTLSGVFVQQDYTKAFQLLSYAAQNNVPQASDALGDIYYQGLGVPVDYSEAFKCYTVGHQNEIPNSTERLGLMYCFGYGVPQDEDAAYPYLKEAADKGLKISQYMMSDYCLTEGKYTDFEAGRKYLIAAAEQDMSAAQYDLARYYISGTCGFVVSIKKFVYWLKKSAENGDSDAEFELGRAYIELEADELPKNYAKAVKWLEIADSHGNTKAAAYLADLYEKGNGVSKDIKKALKYYDKAAASGDEVAASKAKHVRAERAKKLRHRAIGITSLIAVVAFIALCFLTPLGNKLYDFAMTTFAISDKSDNEDASESLADSESEEEKAEYQSEESYGVVTNNGQHLGNDFQNISGGGVCISYNNNYYYINNWDGYKVYCLHANGTTERMTDFGAFYLNLWDGWIWFAQAEYPYQLYKMQADGSGLQVALASQVYEPRFADGWIYYNRRDDDYSLYRVQVDGSNEEKIIDTQAYYCCITEDRIWYVDYNDEQKGYSSALDGSDIQLWNNQSLYCLDVQDDILYYSFRDSAGICSYDTKTSEELLVSYQNATCVNAASDGWIYFSNTDETASSYGELDRIRTDGTELTTLSTQRSRLINVYGGYVYYQDADDTSADFSFYYMNAYGGTPLKLTVPSSYVPPESTQAVFFNNHAYENVDESMTWTDAEIYAENTPFSQEYWVIFTEGNRSDRVEASTIDSTLSSNSLYLIWNGSLDLNDYSGSEECNQYFLTDSNEWETIGTYGRLTDKATAVIASNLDVYDSSGNLILAKSRYDDIDWSIIDSYR